jgi:hypothetical protein
MADPQQEVTPPVESIWPPTPHRDPEPLALFVSGEGVELIQAGGRLIVVNHFMRRVFALQMCILSLSSLSPFYSYWTSPFHHATWRAMLPAVFRTYQNTFWVYLLMLFLAALLYWVLVVSGNLSGIVLDPRSGTAKAAEISHSLSELKSVEIIRRQPDILGRRYTVQLQWSDNQVLPKWQRALLSLGQKTSFVGLFRQEANADRLAKAVAEFARIPLQHRRQ